VRIFGGTTGAGTKADSKRKRKSLKKSVVEERAKPEAVVWEKCVDR